LFLSHQFHLLFFKAIYVQSKTKQVLHLSPRNITTAAAYRGITSAEGWIRKEGITKTREDTPSPQPKTPYDQIKSPGHIDLTHMCPLVRIPAACCFLETYALFINFAVLDGNKYWI
jgi:hypothetical protein